MCFVCDMLKNYAAPLYDHVKEQDIPPRAMMASLGFLLGVFESPEDGELFGVGLEAGRHAKRLHQISHSDPDMLVELLTPFFSEEEAKKMVTIFKKSPSEIARHGLRQGHADIPAEDAQPTNRNHNNPSFN